MPRPHLLVDSTAEEYKPSEEVSVISWQTNGLVYFMLPRPELFAKGVKVTLGDNVIAFNAMMMHHSDYPENEYKLNSANTLCIPRKILQAHGRERQPHIIPGKLRFTETTAKRGRDTKGLLLEKIVIDRKHV